MGGEDESGGAVSEKKFRTLPKGDSNCCAAERLNLMPELRGCQQTYILYKIGE